MSEAIDPSTVIRTARTLEPGDEVRVARKGYEWSSPLDVVDVQVVDWKSPGGGFSTAAVTVESRSQLDVEATSGDDYAIIIQSDLAHALYRFDLPSQGDGDDAEAADEVDGPEAEHDCPDCDRAFDTERGLNIHRGQVHNGGDELSEGIDEELGVEPVDDSDPGAEVNPTDDDQPGEEASEEFLEGVSDATRSLPSTNSKGNGNGSSRGAARVSCQNCGNSVSQRYASVFSPEENPTSVRCCPACPDMIRTKDGQVRPARSSRSNARMTRGGSR